jgi:flagellar operon protein
MKEVVMENYRIGAENVGHIKPTSGKRKIPFTSKTPNAEFAKELDNSLKQLTRLKFSGHAIGRLADRGVQLTGERAMRLENAIDVAEKKGSRDSLVLLDELAFVVSVKNRTVVTACDMQGMKEGVFTKIDSTILG